MPTLSEDRAYPRSLCVTVRRFHDAVRDGIGDLAWSLILRPQLGTSTSEEARSKLFHRWATERPLQSWQLVELRTESGGFGLDGVAGGQHQPRERERRSC